MDSSVVMQKSVAMTAPVTLFTRSGVDAIDDRGQTRRRMVHTSDSTETPWWLKQACFP
jgi:hypothetical protein